MLAFDIGGTFIKYAVIEKNKIVFKNKVETPSGELVVEKLKQIIVQCNSNYRFSQIGISTAGQVDTNEGSIKYAGPTIPNYTNVQLKSELEHDTDKEVFVINDIEACMYNYVDHQSLLYLGIGTGIGGGYVSNYQVYTGDNGYSLEVGHMHHPSGKTFEDTCSTTALLANYKAVTNETITGEELDTRFSNCDYVAIQVVDQFYEDLASGLSNILLVLDCNTIVFGGGITEAKFFNPQEILDHLKVNNPMFKNRNIQISKSELGNDAAIYGVARYVTNINE